MESKESDSILAGAGPEADTLLDHLMAVLKDEDQAANTDYIASELYDNLNAA